MRGTQVVIHYDDAKTPGGLFGKALERMRAVQLKDRAAPRPIVRVERTLWEHRASR